MVSAAATGSYHFCPGFIVPAAWLFLLQFFPSHYLAINIRANLLHDFAASRYAVLPGVQAKARESICIILGDDGKKIGCGFFVAARRALTSLHHFYDEEANAPALESLIGQQARRTVRRFV